MQFAGNFEKGIQGSRRKDLGKYSSSSACLNVSLLALIAETLFIDIFINRLCLLKGQFMYFSYIRKKKKKVGDHC